MSRAERLAMLETDHPELSLKVQAELLGISYSSLFYTPVPPSERELAIKRRIDEIYTAHPYYGSRKITENLRLEFGVARPTIQPYTLAPAVPVQVCVKWAFLPLCRVRRRANQHRTTRFSRTCCVASRPSIPTISRVSISRTSP